MFTSNHKRLEPNPGNGFHRSLNPERQWTSDLEGPRVAVGVTVVSAGFRSDRKGREPRVSSCSGWESPEGGTPEAGVAAERREPRVAEEVDLHPRPMRAQMPLPMPESGHGYPRGGAGWLVRVVLRGSQLEVALPQGQRRGPRIASGRRGDEPLPQRARGLEP